MTMLNTTLWDPSEHLDDPEMIAEYLNAALEENDQELLLTVLNNIAKAKGMTNLAKETGLARPSLYKALRSGAKPEYATINKIIQGLGLSLYVTTRHS